jgi:DNA-3-methyladenine glycosylase I
LLESAQAGLSWLTTLKRREGYRRLYDGFNVIKIAKYKEEKILNGYGSFSN